MHTQLCLSQLQHPRPHRAHRNPHRGSRSHGQVLVIFAVALVALLFFVGLAVDAGVMYVNYGQLKRAVDSAAVNAANNFKRGKSVDQMAAAALEEMRMHNTNVANMQLSVHVCDEDQDGFRDESLQTSAPDFYKLCPLTNPNVEAGSGAAAPRKLVYVQARQFTPFYFLSLLGWPGINLSTFSVAEAAPIDMVIVIDTSESMAAECNPDPNTGACRYKSLNYNQNSIDNYNPNVDENGVPGCNTDNSCYPLRDAKDAAVTLINTLYAGYDSIGVVSFDVKADDDWTNGGLVTMGLPGTPKYDQIVDAIHNLKLHDDAPYRRLWPTWQHPGRFNPVNPEDRDGDGQDYDDPVKLGYTCPTPVESDRWHELQPGEPDLFGWGGYPCDADNGPGGAPIYDAFNWMQADPNADPNLDSENEQFANDWLSNTENHNPSLSVAGTCTGCAIRTASEILKNHGRPNSVWVIVFLSDGNANLSDTNASVGAKIPVGYGPNGFCQGALAPQDDPQGGFWPLFCSDDYAKPRYCMDTNSVECPPDTTWVNGLNTDPRYSVDDYARDLTDEMALTIHDTTDLATKSKYNPQEPLGNDIAIYTIGLGPVTPSQSFLDNPLSNKYGPNRSTGEKLLRYMAAVGDDGNRVTDPCRMDSLNPVPAQTSCGNYYYAPTGNDLLPIFEDIAGRIYTRISH